MFQSSAGVTIPSIPGTAVPDLEALVDPIYDWPPASTPWIWRPDGHGPGCDCRPCYNLWGLPFEDECDPYDEGDPDTYDES